MRPQPSTRHQGRRVEVAPRQAESSSTKAEAATTTSINHAETLTSTILPSSSATQSPSTSTSRELSSSSSSTSVPQQTSSSNTSSRISSSTRSFGDSASIISTSLSPSSSSTSQQRSTSFTSTTTPASLFDETASSSSSSNVTPSTFSEPTPMTTLVIPAPSFTTTSFQTSTFNPSVTNVATLSSNNGFWANKGAVAGTFTVVGLIIIGAVVGFAFFLKRRSRDGRSPGDSEYYENFNAQPQMEQFASGGATPPNAGGLPASPGLSTSELSAQVPMDPHANNHSYAHPDYMPYASQGLAPIHERGSNTSTSTLTPAFKRPVAGRDSYQPSVDSFYGAP